MAKANERWKLRRIFGAGFEKEVEPTNKKAIMDVLDQHKKCQTKEGTKSNPLKIEDTEPVPYIVTTHTSSTDNALGSEIYWEHKGVLSVHVIDEDDLFLFEAGEAVMLRSDGRE